MIIVAHSGKEQLKVNHYRAHKAVLYIWCYVLQCLYGRVVVLSPTSHLVFWFITLFDHIFDTTVNFCLDVCDNLGNLGNLQ